MQRKKGQIIDASVSGTKRVDEVQTRSSDAARRSSDAAQAAPRGRRNGNGAAKTAQSSAPAKENGKAAAKQNGKKQPQSKESPIRIAFLGGLNEVGKNMTLYEYEDDMFLVDCGLAFPDQDMLGVDIVIPDFSYVERNADKIRGVVITHGQEDHIGSLPYLLKNMQIPVYGTRLTIGLIRGKLREHGLLYETELNEVKPGDTIQLGGFSVEMIHVNHSIPDSLALAIRCAQGTIVQTGDFKIDTTPIDGDMIDLARLAEIGKEGVLCLLSDSTNAERPGYTESERKVGESFETLFRKAQGRRLIVATFASNIHRVQQIINVAQTLGRKVALIGRSLENVVSISSELGYLDVPEGVLISIDAINRYPADKIVIITTGSQGEPMSALTRMAMSEHRKVEICPTDCVIISATPIPGNEKTVGRVVNELMKLGAEVVYERMYEVHVSGHACQEELKMMMGLVKPKYFIPVHGELKHLRKHAALAQSMGMDKADIFLADNGCVAEITQNSFRQAAGVPSGRVFVDGYGVGDVGSIVLRDRKHLAQDGIIMITAAVDGETNQLLSGPEIFSRGFVYVRESEALIEDVRVAATQTLEDFLDRGAPEWNIIKGKLRDRVSQLLYERTKRSPMVLPVILVL